MSACRMGEVKLIDSKVKSTLPSSLKEKLARIYGEFSTKDGILVSRIPCQQQEGALDFSASPQPTTWLKVMLHRDLTRA